MSLGRVNQYNHFLLKLFGVKYFWTFDVFHMMVDYSRFFTPYLEKDFVCVILSV